MAPLEARQAHARERLAGADEIAPDGERRLALGPLRDEVATRVLRQVADPPVALDCAGCGLQQPGRDLRERRLTDAVAARQSHDLAAPELERRAVEHLR